MLKKSVFVGCDVSKDKLDFAISLDGFKYDSLSILNNDESVKGFFSYLKSTFKNSSFYFGYEATSNYMNTLKKLITTEKNFHQVMINPYAMSHYLKHLNSRKKNDILDSVGICKYIQTLDQEEFKTTFNQSEIILKKYTSLIDLLRKLETQLKNFRHSQLSTPIESLDQFISELIRKINEIKRLIEKEAQNVLIELYPHVKTIKNEIAGVGYALLLELIPIFLKSRNYTIKQIQSFVGLSPREFESGSSVKKRDSMSKRGSALVRKLLYLSAMSATRCNEVIQEKYKRLVATGKNKMVCLVACMSHLLRAIYSKFNQGLLNVL